METPKFKELNIVHKIVKCLPVSRYSVVLKVIGSQSSTILCIAFSREYSYIIVDMEGGRIVVEERSRKTYFTGTSTDRLHLFKIWPKIILQHLAQSAA